MMIEIIWRNVVKYSLNKAWRLKRILFSVSLLTKSFISQTRNTSI